MVESREEISAAEKTAALPLELGQAGHRCGNPRVLAANFSSPGRMQRASEGNTKPTRANSGFGKARGEAQLVILGDMAYTGPRRNLIWGRRR